MTSRKEKALSHHQHIVEQIRGWIVEGHWPAGHALSSETDMAADYGVSRMTVNKALSQLAREGFLERKRRAGTFVAPRRSESAVLAISDIQSDVEALGAVYSYRTLKRVARRANEEDLKRLHLTSNDTMVLHILGLHSADDTPYCAEDRLIHLGVVPEARTMSFDTQAAGTWLLRRIPWSAADHLIRALGADTRTARLLKLKQGAPCLALERITSFNGMSVTAARLIYPADRHQVKASFKA